MATRVVGQLTRLPQLLWKSSRGQEWQPPAVMLPINARFSTTAKTSGETDNNQAELRSFDQIPGPRALPILGTGYKYMPLGEYRPDRIHQTGMKKFLKYGPIVREKLNNIYYVFLFDPADFETMYQQEWGMQPQRRSHLAVNKYRTDRPHIYNTGGLLSTNGSEWARLRTSLQKPLSRPQNVRLYIPDVDSVAQELCERTAWLVKEEKTDDFIKELEKVFLELTGLVALDTRLGCLKKDVTPDSRPMKLIQAAYDVNSNVFITDTFQLWHWFETKTYKIMSKGQAYIEKVALELVKKKLEEMKWSSPSEDSLTILETFLKHPDLDAKDAVGMATDMLLAGIDTSSFTMSFILYHLATNPEKQEKLYEEVSRILPTDDTPITTEILSSALYAKAVIKESLRLNPIAVGTGRLLQEDVVFSGYKVHKGTYVVTQNQVSCRLPQYVKDPEHFLPERWLKGHPLYENIHPYLSLPFSHGPRNCIGRRLAEQNMYIVLMRLMQKFHMEWHHGLLDCLFVNINKPDKPLYLSFFERKQ